jgi:hypothetical protein
MTGRIVFFYLGKEVHITSLRACSVPAFIEGVYSVLGYKIWAKLKHSKTLKNTSGLFDRPVLAGLESKKHPKTRWVGVG